MWYRRHTSLVLTLLSFTIASPCQLQKCPSLDWEERWPRNDFSVLHVSHANGDTLPGLVGVASGEPSSSRRIHVRRFIGANLHPLKISVPIASFAGDSESDGFPIHLEIRCSSTELGTHVRYTCLSMALNMLNHSHNTSIILPTPPFFNTEDRRNISSMTPCGAYPIDITRQFTPHWSLALFVHMELG